MGVTPIETVLTEEQVRTRVKEMAEEIREAYAGKKPLLVAVLKGSVFFLADLCRELGPGYPIDFLSVTSYNGNESTGAAEIRLDLGTDVAGRSVLIVEDIVDTGLTLQYLLGLLRARGPKSVKVAVLLFKPDAYRGAEVPDFIGFRLPKQFVVGYGMDLDQEWRNLKFVGRIRES